MSTHHLRRLALLLLVAAAAHSHSPAAAAALADAPAVQPTTALPYSPGLDPSAMDRAVDPCEDLYTYACGGWQKSNPIPPDQTGWSVYHKATFENQRYLWGILEDVSAPSIARTPEQQRIGDYFASCMAVGAVDAAGTEPVRADLERIAALPSIRQFAALIADLHNRLRGGSILFAADVEQDEKDATVEIAGLGSGGLGLPDRDYYVKDDDKSREIRTRYEQHVARVLELSGTPAAEARGGAAFVMRFETALARAALTAVEKRDPHAVYHRQSLSELEATAPNFEWRVYLAATRLAGTPWINDAEPVFMRELNARLGAEQLEDLKIYLRWTVLDAAAPYLAAPLAEEDFAFNHAYLLGAQREAPRWRKCVAWVDRDLGEALGQEFARRTFPPATRAKAQRMTRQIETAMRQRINALTWMSPATKAEALAKLAAVRNKIGYPRLWRDYSALDIEHEGFFGNVVRATEFESHRQAAKIGKPVERDEWSMTPPTVDAQYDPLLNDITFPAGVLQPPLYDARLDDAPNYGDTGGTIGHELTHAFDDQGRQFDGQGNLRDWWTDADAKGFLARAQCIRDQYAEYTVVGDVKINSALTLGEDIADLGGELLGWMAWREQTRGMKLPMRDGLTPEQRFFVGFAQWTCSNDRPERLRALAIDDPHSPARYRINGVVANMPEFARAFHCKAGQALVKPPGKLCTIW
jgi:endothelin-converting enzyme/putative endopeptidase